MGGLTFKASRWFAMCWTLLSICFLGCSETNSFKNVPPGPGPGPGPYFYRGPESQTVISGERVILRCTLAQDNFQFWLSWQRDNVFLPTEDVMRDPITYSKSPDGITMGEYSLTINSVTVDDAGNYKCVLANGTGKEGEENPEVVLRSPIGSLIVVEPVTTTTTTTTTSTTPPLKGHFNNGHEFDSKGSVRILPKSESEMEPIEDEGVPGPGPNPPVSETTSYDGDPYLLYYIIAGLLIGAIILLLIIVIILLFKTYNLTCRCRCPCKAGAVDPGLVQTQLNSNLSQKGPEDVVLDGVGLESQTEPGASGFEMFENQELFHPPFSNYTEELMYCSIHNPYVYQLSSFEAENEYSEVYV